MISRYFGCEVYDLEQSVQRFSDLPYIVAIDDELSRENVVIELKHRNIEAYRNFEEYYQGEIQAVVDTVTCGKIAVFQIVPSLLMKNEKNIVYSFGVGFDDSFEMELTKKYEAEV